MRSRSAIGAITGLAGVMTFAGVVAAATSGMTNCRPIPGPTDPDVDTKKR